MTDNERKQIEYCLSLYDKLKQQNTTVNDLFKVFYEVKARLRRILNNENKNI